VVNLSREFRSTVEPQECNTDCQRHRVFIMKKLLQLNVYMYLQLALLFMPLHVEAGFVEIGSRTISSSSNPKSGIRLRHGFSSLYANNNYTFHEEVEICPELAEEVKAIAELIWKGEKIPTLRTCSPSPSSANRNMNIMEGEAQLPTSTSGEIIMRALSDRAEFFQQEALLKGCPKAQHSYGLLLWSGFAGMKHDPSSRFQAGTNHA